MSVATALVQAADEVIQPSKEWVLPARGKPGRKPSATVPLTKRKAQNRESQRAFRERRHAYLAELEDKVAQYEAREISANVQMQRLAQQCRDEANELRRKNEALEQRCSDLQQQVTLLLQKAPNGCIPPVHERSENQTLAPTPTAAPSSPPSLPSIAAALQPSESSAEELELDCGFCSERTPCVCRGQARLELDDTPPHADPLPLRPSRTSRLWYTVPATSWNNSSPSDAQPLRVRPRTNRRLPLWATESSKPACTGNPAQCRACNLDPALAEFCSAVSRNVQLPVSIQREETGCESIPEAFTRLRNHPNFTRWRGGLDMLAEVVSRDSINQGAEATNSVWPTPSMPSRKRTRNEVYVRSSAVSEALAMLDRREDNRDRPCPCPWVNSSARLPWPNSAPK